MSVPNPNNIPGIFNWCDRWCERCPMTARCTLYQQEQEDRAILESDLSQEEKMEKIREKLTETLEMLGDSEEEFEMDFDEIDEEEQEEVMHEQEINEIKIDIHPISDLSESYMKESMEWLRKKRKDPVFIPYFDIMYSEEKFPIPPSKEISKVINLLETVQWYQTMIPVKCRSAFNYLADKSFWDDYPVEERGYNGTAKVALLCVDNSIKAWKGLLFWSNNEEDSIMPLIEKLIEIKHMMESEFPDAYLFIRPGFDKKEDESF
ncbi:hypothetical protein [Shivajiella indica]|uniref:DUF4253 domain-containing protein n=1 Tax=Shivajiella indica TaxID=872115 RepID=A0ABW5B8L4_9BACT